MPGNVCVFSRGDGVGGPQDLLSTKFLLVSYMPLGHLSANQAQLPYRSVAAAKQDPRRVFEHCATASNTSVAPGAINARRAQIPH